MKQYFVTYLKHISANHALARESIKSVVSQANSLQDLSPIKTMFKVFPIDIENAPPPVDPRLIENFAITVNQLLWIAEPTDFSLAGNINNDKPEAVRQELNKNKLFQHFINGMVNLACRELLDENGNLTVTPVNLLFTELGQQYSPRKDKAARRNFLILSYINDILWPSITRCWRNSNNNMVELLGKMSVKSFAEKIFTHVKFELRRLQSPSNCETQLSNAINKIQKDEVLIKKINDSEMAEILNTLQAAIVGPLSEVDGGVMSAFLNVFQEILTPTEKFSDVALKYLTKAYQAEGGKIVAAGLSYVKDRIDLLTQEVIRHKCNDITLYGIPLTAANEDYITYLTDITLSNEKEFVVSLVSQGSKLFGEEELGYLANYLHNFLILKPGKSLANNINSFSKKIILFACWQLLDDEGKLKSKIVSYFKTKNSNLMIDDKFRVFLVDGYTRALFVMTMVTWLEDQKFQDEFLKAKTQSVELERLINSIEFNLINGLDVQFLNDIKSFPIFKKKDLIPKFTIKLCGSASDKMLWVEVDKIKKKALLLNNARTTAVNTIRDAATRVTALQETQAKIVTNLSTLATELSQYAQVFQGIQLELYSMAEASTNFTAKIASSSSITDHINRGVSDLTNIYLKAKPEAMQQECAAFQEALTKLTVDLAETCEIGNQLSRTTDLAIQSISKIKDVLLLWMSTHKYMNNFAHAGKETALNILPIRERYIVRRDFFPKTLSYNSNWDNMLENEKQIIETSFVNIKAEFEKMTEFCEGLKSWKFNSFIDNNLKVLQTQIENNFNVVQHNAENIDQAVATISSVAVPFLTAVKGAKEHQEKVFVMVKFILNETQHWGNCVSFFGGERYIENGISVKAPKRELAMRLAANGQDANTDPDFKLDSILQAFANTKPGYFGRFDATSIFYEHIKAINTLKQRNFYNIDGLIRIEERLEDYMRTVGEARYQMYSRYQAAHGVKAMPSPFQQAYSAVVETAARLMS
jgi:hypothetical protein